MKEALELFQISHKKLVMAIGFLVSFQNRRVPFFKNSIWNEKIDYLKYITTTT